MLAEFKSDLFATHVTMPAALRYVNELCAAAASDGDSVAIRTAAHIVLNTAIELHRTEMQALKDKVNELTARKDPVTALLTLVQEQVAKAIVEQPLDEKIENWMADNLRDYIENHLQLEENIYQQVAAYFGNNSFTIEPR